MRVLLTTESYLPYLSGVTVAVDALARGLGAAGHDVMVLAPRPASGAADASAGSRGPEPRHAWLPSYELPRIAPPGYRMPWPLPFSEALRDARRFEPDVVHAHSPFVSGLMARRVARRSGAPLVFTHHTRFVEYAHYAGPLRPLAARLTDAYLWRFWRGCAAVIAPSSDLAAEIDARRGSEVNAARARVIPTGVDVAGIRALEPIDLRAELGWDPGCVVVASLGRLAPEKSPVTVLEAFRQAALEVSELRLLVIGGGPSEPELRRHAQGRGMAGRVHFTGGRPRPEALALLKAADLFAFASGTETQGLVLAEALVAGVPAVSLAGPGVADSIRHGTDGIIVPRTGGPSDVANLAAALAHLATDGTERGRLAGAAADGAERFSVDRRIGEVDALYRAVMG